MTRGNWGSVAVRWPARGPSPRVLRPIGGSDPRQFAWVAPRSVGALPRGSGMAEVVDAAAFRLDAFKTVVNVDRGLGVAEPEIAVGGEHSGHSRQDLLAIVDRQ